MKRIKFTLFGITVLITTILVSCGEKEVRSKVKDEQLINEIKSAEESLKAKIGVAVYDTETKETWGYNEEEKFPLMSTFKSLSAAKFLFDVDNGKVSLDEKIMIKEEMILEYAPVTKEMIGKQMTSKEIIEAFMTRSDNTAVNIISNLVI